MKPEKVSVQMFFDELFRYYSGTVSEQQDDKLAMLRAITENPHYERAAELLLIKNEMFDSSQFGRQSVLMCGPALTVKTAADLDRNRPVTGDLPSQWKLPIIYVELTDDSRRAIKELVRKEM